MTAKALQLLAAPYDSGHRGERMGAGPQALLRAGAVERLRALGHDVRTLEVEPASEWRAELRTGFELMREVALAAAAAHREGRVPLLLAGNCGTTVGMLAALQAAAGRPRAGLVWFDAHGDCNTPETDASGFLDGQGLAIAVGWCWRAAAATVPGFAPLPESRVLHVGVRALDDGESSATRASGIAWLPADAAHDPAAIRAAVERLAGEVDVVHVHIDLDVHDPSVAPANSYAEPGGLTAAEVRGAVRAVAARLPIASATLASYDPALDADGQMADTALQLLELLGAAAASPADR